MRRRYVPNLMIDMAECDANYIRLGQLFPRMAEADNLKFGIPVVPVCVTKGADVGNKQIVVELIVTKRCPYTTMMTVHVSNAENSNWIQWPTLDVRIYHDSKSAEVVSFERHRNIQYRYAILNDHMYQPDEKSQTNKFFGELLSYCLEYGHSLDVLSFTKT